MKYGLVTPPGHDHNVHQTMTPSEFYEQRIIEKELGKKEKVREGRDKPKKEWVEEVKMNIRTI